MKLITPAQTVRIVREGKRVASFVFGSTYISSSISSLRLHQPLLGTAHRIAKSHLHPSTPFSDASLGNSIKYVVDVCHRWNIFAVLLTYHPANRDPLEKLLLRVLAEKLCAEKKLKDVPGLVLWLPQSISSSSSTDLGDVNAVKIDSSHKHDKTVAQYKEESRQEAKNHDAAKSFADLSIHSNQEYIDDRPLENRASESIQISNTITSGDYSDVEDECTSHAKYDENKDGQSMDHASREQASTEQQSTLSEKDYDREFILKPENEDILEFHETRYISDDPDPISLDELDEEEDQLAMSSLLYNHPRLGLASLSFGTPQKPTEACAAWSLQTFLDAYLTPQSYSSSFVVSRMHDPAHAHVYNNPGIPSGPISSIFSMTSLDFTRLEKPPEPGEISVASGPTGSKIYGGMKSVKMKKKLWKMKEESNEEEYQRRRRMFAKMKLHETFAQEERELLEYARVRAVQLSGGKQNKRIKTHDIPANNSNRKKVAE